MKIVVLVLISFLPLFAITSYTTAQKQKYLHLVGEKIANTTCKEFKNKHYHSIDALYEAIKKECSLEEKRYYDALAYYLWDKGSHHHIKEQLPTLEYTKKDKCPICGMFVYKYPQWVAMIVTDKKTLYFDGVKDLMKYYFTHQKEVKSFYAQDYYTKNLIELHKAYFVLGSDVYGPMGDELIPFLHKKDAQTFMLDHRGKKIVTLKQLTQEMVEKLDE
jgi:nitrous oxide reductase accessory protein NosL